MDRNDFMTELLYRDVGREVTEQAEIIDLEYAGRAADALGEIYQVLRENHVDSRTRIRKIQSIMYRYQVFGPREQLEGKHVSLGEYLTAQVEVTEPREQEIEKPRRGRPRKYPKID